MPNIREALYTIVGFQFPTVIDLNIYYCAMMLDEEIQKNCKILLHWVKYMYQGLPMGIFIAPSVFQEEMSMLFQ